METQPPTTTSLKIGSPKLFDSLAVWVINAYGLLLVFPFLVSVMAVSVIPFGILTAVIPLLCVLASAYYLPLAFGNAYVVRLAQALKSPAGTSLPGQVVQLTLSPRTRTGLRAALEDADDIGCLHLGESGMVFQGDSIALSVPYAQLKTVQLRNVGLRGLWLYGQRIEITVTGLPNVQSFQFAERSSWLLPESRRVTRELYQQLSLKAEKK